MITKKAFSNRLGLLCFIFLFGCSEPPMYVENTPITNLSWSHNQVPEFKVHISSTNKNFDIFLNLRHTSRYKFSNLSLIIQETNPEHQQKNHPLTLQLADEDGRWEGVGTGNILAYHMPVLKDYHFSDTGMYTFKIQQNMNVDPLLDVVDIGISISNSKKLNP